MFGDYMAVAVVGLMVKGNSGGRRGGGGRNGTTSYVITGATDFISYILVQNIFFLLC